MGGGVCFGAYDRDGVYPHPDYGTGSGATFSRYCRGIVGIGAVIFASFITVIPALANGLLGKTARHPPGKRIHLPVLDWFGGLVQAGVKRWAIFLTQHQILTLTMVGVVAGATVWASTYFLPKLEYLPEGNRNFLFGIVFPPPGYNLKTMVDIASRVENQVKPYWASAASQRPEMVKNQQFPKTEN